MAFSEIYVDPSIAGDSGAGTIGDPYGDLEYAIEQVTFDTTNGTRFNIKAGTAEIVVANLYTATQDTGTSIAYVTSATAPLVFQGYTATAGDGGVGELDANAQNISIYSSNDDYIHFIDLKCHNTGNQPIIDVDRQCNVIRCDIYNSSSGVNGFIAGLTSNVIGCHIYNVRKTSLQGFISHCYIDTTAAASPIVGALIGGGFGCSFVNNIVVVSGVADGIQISSGAICVMNNSIYSSSSSSNVGLELNTNINGAVITGNIIEGFTTNYKLDTSGVTLISFGGNASYNAGTTEYTTTNAVDLWKDTGNETLIASAFTSAATGDFSPVDTGLVKEGTVPESIGNGA